jgi:hypothetical protein
MSVTRASTARQKKPMPWAYEYDSQALVISQISANEFTLPTAHRIVWFSLIGGTKWEQLHMLCVSTVLVLRADSLGKAAQWFAESIRESWGVLWLIIRLISVRADVSNSVIKAFFLVQLGYLEVTVQEKLRSGWPGPFVKVEGCCG